MEILTLRSPGRAPHTYRLYSITPIIPNSFAVVEHEWCEISKFQPHESILFTGDVENWYRELYEVLEVGYPSMRSRSIDYSSLFHNWRLVTNIIDRIAALNRGWASMIECSTAYAQRLFLLRRPPAVENRPTLSETLRTTEAVMRGLAATVSAVAPSMEVGLDGLWELARALQLPERVLDGQYKGSFSTDSLRFEVRKPENIADTVDDLREASETAKKYLAEREAEEERLRALRDEEARKPPTRSGSIE